MQKARVLGFFVGAMVVLLAAALLVIWLLVNPNNYKGTIAAKVKESTGRDLQLPGDIKLSVFPWVALEVGPARLGNPPGFGDAPMVAMSHATFRVKVLPLLRGRLEVSRLELDGLDVRLRRNAEGRGNWQSAATSSASSPTRAADTPPPRSLASFGQISIRGGRVSYDDISIEHLELEVGAAALHRDIPVSISFDAHRGDLSEAIAVKATFDVSAESTAQQFGLAAVHLSGTLGRAGEDAIIPWELAAPALAVNLAEQSAQAAAFTLSCAGAHLSGSAVAAKLLDDLSLLGSITLAPVVPREFAPRVGMSIPQTQDPKAWTQLSASVDFAYAAKAWTLSHLRAHLDDTQLQGNIKYSGAETPIFKFDLAVDRIDVDRYRPLKAGADGRDAKAPIGASEKSKPFAADGTLAAATLDFSGMEFTDLRLTVATQDSVMRLSPIEAQIDGGRYSGNITLDDRGPLRSVGFDEHLAGIDMARLLAHGAQKGRLSGRATLNLKGSARGAGMDALLKTSTGHFDVDLADGALEGIDLEYQRDRAQALIDRSPSSREDTKRTRFDEFKASAQLTNGIAETHDLVISTQALRVTGQGSANLATKAINFQLLASILQAPAKTLVDIPLRVTGTYADPAVKADIDSLAKEQLKQKLKDVLKKNGLQGLFGK